MESVSGVASGLFTVALLAMATALVARKRKHLRLVCRVINQQDHKVLDFLDQLVQSGDLIPAPVA